MGEAMDNSRETTVEMEKNRRMLQTKYTFLFVAKAMRFRVVNIKSANLAGRLDNNKPREAQLYIPKVIEHSASDWVTWRLWPRGKDRFSYVLCVSPDKNIRPG